MPIHAPLLIGAVPDYGGYDAPGSNDSKTAAEEEEEADAGAAVPSESERGPEEPMQVALMRQLMLLCFSYRHVPGLRG